MRTLHTRMFRAMPDCDTAAAASWRQVHGKPMRFRERVALESHLLACRTCRRHRRHLKWLQQSVENLTPDPAAPSK